jgi:hypothetical protein
VPLKCLLLGFVGMQLRNGHIKILSSLLHAEHSTTVTGRQTQCAHQFIVRIHYSHYCLLRDHQNFSFEIVNKVNFFGRRNNGPNLRGIKHFYPHSLEQTFVRPATNGDHLVRCIKNCILIWIFVFTTLWRDLQRTAQSTFGSFPDALF